MALTMQQLLDQIDPNPSNWESRGQNRFWHVPSKRQVDASDLVQAMLNEYNAGRREEGKSDYVAGIHPVPDAIKRPTTPAPSTGGGGTTPPPSSGGGGPPALPGGGGPSGNPVLNPGEFYLPGFDDGSTWNPAGGSGGQGLNPAAAFSPAPTWEGGTGGDGRANPVRTGMAQAFKPFGSIEGYSSEILRYGGRPHSRSDGRWEGIDQPQGLVSVGGTPQAPGDGVDVPGFTPIRPPYQAPTSGGGYQNIVRDPRDGTLWTDPNNGQRYVFRNGQWAKIDTTSRPGPTKETPVTNNGGTGSATDPIRIDIGGGTSPEQILAHVLRYGTA